MGQGGNLPPLKMVVPVTREYASVSSPIRNLQNAFAHLLNMFLKVEFESMKEHILLNDQTKAFDMDHLT